MKPNLYLQIIADVLVITFLILFPHYAQLPYALYIIPCFLLIIFYLKRKHKTLRDVGLKRKGLNGHVVIIGVVSAVIWMAFVKLIYLPFIHYFFADYVKPYTEYDFIKNNFGALVMVIVIAWVGGGFYEEIAFRGYMQYAIKKWFSSVKAAFWLAAIIVSILFGLYHWQQGVFGVIGGVMCGMYWSFIFKRYNHNLWYSIVSHAVYDTIALIMIYLGVL